MDQNLMNKYGKKIDGELEFFLHLYSYTSQNDLRTLFDDRIIDNFNNGPTIEKFRQCFSHLENQDLQTKMMYTFEILHLPGLLFRLDSTTMGASVEGRVPFVDHELVEYAFKLPNAIKMKWISNPPTGILGDRSSEIHDVTKWVLKQACSDLLPEEIINRKKVGFPVPLHRWFGPGSGDELREKLTGGLLVKSGLISKRDMNSFLDSEENNNPNPMLIWMLLNLEIFFEENPGLAIKSNYI